MFDAGFGPQTIALTSGQLLFTDTLTSDGAMQGVTVSGSGQSRVWVIMQTHLHAACDPADIPQTGNGNPKVARFDYAMEHAMATTFTYVVDDPGCCDGGPTSFAAHAVVVDTGDCWDVDGDGVDDECRRESAWAGGSAGFEFPGGNWATYFQCDCMP